VFASTYKGKGAPRIDSVKYISMDIHKEAISISVLNSSSKLVMECTIETKAITILEFFKGLHRRHLRNCISGNIPRESHRWRNGDGGSFLDF
jgi:hypothetical protein